MDDHYRIRKQMSCFWQKPTTASSSPTLAGGTRAASSPFIPGSYFSHGETPKPETRLDEPEDRNPSNIYFLACALKALLSTVLVVSLIVGYALDVTVFTIGLVSLGLYGIILRVIVDFLV
ncbi:hypothetical protein C8J56DRAFT_1062055 [Mycena floridula]|nr:hypothetical protein C8J56DRAFT_1062055 [Mycena floridula]